jgi:hypothetical protein
MTSVDAPTADDLYGRYMKSAAAHRDLSKSCAGRCPDARCAAGQHWHDSFAHLQEAYLNRLRQQS